MDVGAAAPPIFASTPRFRRPGHAHLESYAAAPLAWDLAERARGYSQTKQKPSAFDTLSRTTGLPDLGLRDPR